MTTNQKAIIHYCDVRMMETAIFGKSPLPTEFITDVFIILNRGLSVTLEKLLEKHPDVKNPANKGCFD